jgi:adenylate cyclase, class 2
MVNIPDEIESKFYPINIDSIRSSLHALGANCTYPMRLMRRVVFDNIQNPKLPVAYIRVRDEGNKIVLSAKDYADIESGHLHQRELAVDVGDFTKTVDLLTLMGLKPTNRQESKRETWAFKNSEICIDIWPGLEPYIEIESPSVAELEDIIKLLPLSKTRRYEGGALQIYMDVFGWSRDVALDKVRYLRFDE